MPEINEIVFFGDWHGNTRYAEKSLYRLDNARNLPDAYIHVGDFGFWRRYRFHHAVNEVLRRQDREMFVVLGNHEDYDYLEEITELDDRGFYHVLDNLFIVPRGHHWTWNDVTLVGMGGAYSIDRKWRSYRKSWWPQETIKQEDFEKTVAKPADILVTHEAPWLPQGKVKRLQWLTRQEDRESKRGRDYVARAILETGAKLNVHGHHHVFYEKMLKKCRVVGLANDGHPYNTNSFRVNLEDFKRGFGGNI